MERFLLGELRPFWERKRKKEEEGGGGGKEDLFWPALRLNGRQYVTSSS